MPPHSAFAAQDRWTEGYGQGNLEYFIDKGNTRLYIGCPTQEGDTEAKSSVSLFEFVFLIVTVN
jgi:hypothetical protein